MKAEFEARIEGGWKFLLHQLIIQSEKNEIRIADSIMEFGDELFSAGNFGDFDKFLEGCTEHVSKLSAQVIITVLTVAQWGEAPKRLQNRRKFIDVAREQLIKTVGPERTEPLLKGLTK